jgi:hypothetical protein
MDEALSFAKGLNKGRKIIRAMKEGMYKDIVRVMDEEDPPIIETGKLNT